MIQRAINIVLILGANAICLFITSLFFMGTKVTYNEMKQYLFTSFSGRALGGFVLGILACLLVLMVNALINHWKPKDEKVNIFRISLITLLSTTISSILGTAYFFSH